MRIWLSDANCAAIVSRYRKMPRLYKALYYSGIIGPTILTYGALAQHYGFSGLGITSIWFFGPLALIYWLAQIILAANHLRGLLALRRGIEPESVRRKVDYYSPRWELAFWPIIILLFVVLTISGHTAHKNDPGALTMALLFTATFSTVLYQFSVAKFKLYGSVNEN